MRLRPFSLFYLAVLGILAPLGWAVAADVFSAHKGISVRALDTRTLKTARGSQTVYTLDNEKCSDVFAAKLRRSHVELVRFVTDPLPLIEPDAQRAETAANVVVNCAAAYQRQDIAVIVDLHFWSPEPEATMDRIIGSEASLRAYTQALARLAAKLSRWPEASAALELLNEPRLCDGRFPFDWRAVQPILLAKVRAASKDLPVVLSGCGGQLDGLVGLDTSPYRDDGNLIYTFHFYEPFIFTHQQVYYGSKMVDMRYPQSALGVVESVKRSAQTNLHSELLDPPRRASITRDILNYLRRGSNVATLSARFEQVSEWARKNGVEPSRIFLGEFGVAVGANPEKASALYDDSIAWLKDVRGLADRHGFSYAWWIYPRSGGWAVEPSSRYLNPDVVEAIGLDNNAR